MIQASEAHRPTLYDTYSSVNLNLPYDSFPPFDLSQFNEDECSAQFRFKGWFTLATEAES